MASQTKRMNKSSSDIHPILIAGLAIGFLGLVTVIVLLAMLLSQLTTSREHIASTDQQTATLLRDARPLLRGARPVVRSVNEILDPLSAVDASLRSTGRDIPRIGLDVQELANAAPDVRSLVRGATPLLKALASSDLPGTIISSAGTFVAQLTHRSRAVNVVDQTSRLITQIEKQGLIPGAGSSIARLKSILKIQRMTFGIQKQNLNALQNSLAIQRETLVHVRNLDQRTDAIPVLP